MSTTTTNICPVCLDPLQRHECQIVTTVPCGHAYHEDCLKTWATERLDKEKPEIQCPVCCSNVQNVVKLFLSTKSGSFDASLTGQELEKWKEQYDDEAKASQLKLHAHILESNKKVMDEIFEKQKIMETYENDRKALEVANTENSKLRHELFQQIMKHEAEMRRMEANKMVIQEVLERNEKALEELQSTREENLDLKRELLKHIMSKKDDLKQLTASKQALTIALENQEATLEELRKSREESINLKQELVEHLHHHKTKMEQLQTHKESLHEIVLQHQQNVKDLETIKKENLQLKEELVQSMVHRKQEATKLAKCEGWLEVLKDEIASFEKDRSALKRVRTENYRLGIAVQERHKRWLQARWDLQKKINDSAWNQMNLLIVVGQVTMMGIAMYMMPGPTNRSRR